MSDEAYCEIMDNQHDELIEKLISNGEFDDAVQRRCSVLAMSDRERAYNLGVVQGRLDIIENVLTEIKTEIKNFVKVSKDGKT